jgi:hypothetical protein
MKSIPVLRDVAVPFEGRLTPHQPLITNNQDQSLG